MKSIVMITKTDRKRNSITITEYIGVKEKKDRYILESRGWGETGIRKGELEKIITSNYGTDWHKGVTLPYIESWGDKIYYFVNKNKYDLNPTFYQDLVKDYKPE